MPEARHNDPLEHRGTTIRPFWFGKEFNDSAVYPVIGASFFICSNIAAIAKPCGSFWLLQER